MFFYEIVEMRTRNRTRTSIVLVPSQNVPSQRTFDISSVFADAACVVCLDKEIGANFVDRLTASTLKTTEYEVWQKYLLVAHQTRRRGAGAGSPTRSPKLVWRGRPTIPT